VQGKAYEIGKVRGIKVYTNLNRLDVSIKLTPLQGLALKKGQLKVRYTSPEESKYVLYAEAELVIN
jgi:hypothetical protein